MAGVFLVFLMLIGSSSSYATTTQKSFIGCFNQRPDGALQFGAVPSGNLFALRGNTNLAQGHVNQLVRVFGDLEVGRRNGHSAPATLTVHRVQALAASCTSALPSATLDEIPGKVGEDTVAVPLTDTSTEDRTTPGFQIEPLKGRPAGAKSANHLEAPAAPSHAEQVGQSEAAANVNASSVERTEILPGVTLGVSAR